MPERELELLVGETVRIGDYLVTVVDVDGFEVAFRIDNAHPASSASVELSETRPPAK